MGLAETLYIPIVVAIVCPSMATGFAPSPAVVADRVGSAAIVPFQPWRSPEGEQRGRADRASEARPPTETNRLIGIPGNDKRISFRMLHLWEFKDGRMSRENIWLDGGAIAAQLTA